MPAIPIIAIVGQPNVGKSLMFNRMCGFKKALVTKMPGTTRDRNYAECEYDEINFIAIDTGGLDLESNEIIPSLVHQQAQIAIDEADRILFLMDGRLGLTALDQEIALKLRKGGSTSGSSSTTGIRKKVIFAVNKIDTEAKKDFQISDFYRLGVEKIHPVSALTGFGYQNMMANLLEGLPRLENQEASEKERPLQVAVVGRPNVGKSSLLNCLLGEERFIVSELPGTTHDTLSASLESSEGKLILIDTAGLRRKSKVSAALEKYSIMAALRGLASCDIAILMVEASEPLTQQDLKICSMIQEFYKGFILAINKCDLVQHKVLIPRVRKLLERRLPWLSKAPMVAISALKEKGINILLQETFQLANRYNRKIRTHDLSELLQKITKDKQISLTGGRKLRVYYATQTSKFPPTFRLFVNFPDLLKSDQHRYLLNQLDKAYDFSGVPVRLIFSKKSR